MARPKEKAIGAPAKMNRKTSGPKKMARLIGPMLSHVVWNIQSNRKITAFTATAAARCFG